jgi:hypothetical protein
MRYRTIALFALILGSASTANAQTAEITPTEEAKPTLQQRLMPEVTTTLLAPVSEEAKKTIAAETVQPVMMARGSGTGLIIAGAALFVAGLLVDGDAGTLLAVSGAAIGAYGLYLYFQ